MQACLFETRSPSFNKSLVDLRYFYQDVRECVHYSCGMAFQALLDLYRKQAIERNNLRTPHPSSSAQPEPSRTRFFRRTGLPCCYPA